MKITFIINSIARNVNLLVDELRNHSLTQSQNVELCMTTHKGHGRELALKKAQESDLIVAVGGDGTLNEVVNGIMHAALAREDQPRLALIPIGSANDFARMQHITSSLEKLEMHINENAFRKVDVGQILVKSENRKHFFINVTDSGMGAEVVKRMEEKSIFRKILSPDLRFTLAIFRTFLAYRRKKVEILLGNDVSIGGRILTLVVANSSAFGSGLIIAPDAKIDDGRFQLVVGDISFFGYLLSIRRLLKGKKIIRGGVQYHEASNIKVFGPSDLYTQADGELAGAGDIEIECISGAIEFLLPDNQYQKD